jgi:hypothetical protein
LAEKAGFADTKHDSLVVVTFFIHGLANREHKRKAQNETYARLTDVVQKVLLWEVGDASTSYSVRTREQLTGANVSLLQNRSRGRGARGSGPGTRGDGTMCNNCGRHRCNGGDGCPAIGVTCHRCDKVGHFARQCMAAQPASAQRSAGQRGRGGPGRGRWNSSGGRGTQRRHGGNMNEIRRDAQAEGEEEEQYGQGDRPSQTQPADATNADVANFGALSVVAPEFPNHFNFASAAVNGTNFSEMTIRRSRSPVASPSAGRRDGSRGRRADEPGPSGEQHRLRARSPSRA